LGWQHRAVQDAEYLDITLRFFIEDNVTSLFEASDSGGYQIRRFAQTRSVSEQLKTFRQLIYVVVSLFPSPMIYGVVKYAGQVRLGF
jgi:hypothetical protein